jgi:hypothetical protein
LQHGSILLSASPAAPELLGVRELSENRVLVEELQRDWLDRLGEALGETFATSLHSQDVLDAAANLETRKHAQPAWIERR